MQYTREKEKTQQNTHKKNNNKNKILERIGGMQGTHKIKRMHGARIHEGHSLFYYSTILLYIHY